jgi:ABC-type polysaccharide/polyol phosphate transport system ATPase subunit
MVGASGLLRDRLAQALKAPRRVFVRDRKESFWALKDVSIDVREGEVLGLIGRTAPAKPLF